MPFLLLTKKLSGCKENSIILKDAEFKEGISHRRIYRPWGDYLSIVEDADWQVKLINVKPGEKLSLQMHHHRSEHWIVVSGSQSGNR